MVEPRVVVENYTAQWFRQEIDSSELAKLRWIEGRTLRQIAGQLRSSKTTVVRALKRLEMSRIRVRPGILRRPT